MRIALVTDFYSEGMGYTENCLPKALAALGHDVHVVTSNLNVYGTSPAYAATYEGLLGPAEQPCGERTVDGVTVHRLPHGRVGRYVRIRGLVRKVSGLAPDVVQAMSAAGPNTFRLAAARIVNRRPLFTECHQHLSVVHPHLRAGKGHWVKRAMFFASRTAPGRLAARVTQRCYAIAPDCVEVAHRFYGVPMRKIVLLPLGTDTDLFRPVSTPDETAARSSTRRRLGFEEGEVVCIYTGRLSPAKDPLALARAVARLRDDGAPFRGLFVGDGPQKPEIDRCGGCLCVGFVKHRDLPAYYGAADIAVWPTQESMSMLDAASCGLPLVVSERMGEPARVEGNGVTYREGDVADLAASLRSLESAERRSALGDAGAGKMRRSFSWRRVAERRLEDYAAAIGAKGSGVFS